MSDCVCHHVYTNCMYLIDDCNKHGLMVISAFQIFFRDRKPIRLCQLIALIHSRNLCTLDSEAVHQNNALSHLNQFHPLDKFDRRCVYLMFHTVTVVACILEWSFESQIEFSVKHVAEHVI